MENNVDVLLDKISEHVKEMAKTETVVGEEFTIGEYHCKPVVKVGVGFGSGGGTGEHPKHKGHGEGGGAGAGVGISPVGFLISKGSEISFLPAQKQGGFASLLEKVPDLIEKVAELKKDKEEPKAKNEKGSK